MRLASLSRLALVGCMSCESPGLLSEQAASTAQALATFSDDFDDNVADLTTWTVGTSAVCPAEEKNQRLEVSCTTACNGHYGQFVTLNAFDLRNNEVLVELVSLGDPALMQWAPNFHLRAAPDNRVVLNFGRGRLRFYNNLNGVTQPNLSDLPLDGGQRWARFRESAGNIYAETSPDGLGWVVLGSQPAPFSLASVRAYLEGGCDTPIGVPMAVIFDNFNLPRIDAGSSNDAGSANYQDAGRTDRSLFTVGCGCGASEAFSPWLALFSFCLVAVQRSRLTRPGRSRK